MTTLLKLRVVPNASRNEVVGWHGEALKIKVQAPPEDGKANEAVIETLAAALGISRRNIAITHGAKSRDKTVALETLTIEAIRDRLSTSA